MTCFAAVKGTTCGFALINSSDPKLLSDFSESKICSYLLLMCFSKIYMALWQS